MDTCQVQLQGLLTYLFIQTVQRHICLTLRYSANVILCQVNFYRIVIFKGSCPDCPVSLGTCLSNLKSVALIVLKWSDWPVCCTCACAHTRTETHTHWTKTVYLRHSLRSLGGDNYKFVSRNCMYFKRSKLHSNQLVWVPTLPYLQPQNAAYIHEQLQSNFTVQFWADFQEFYNYDITLKKCSTTQCTDCCIFSNFSMLKCLLRNFNKMAFWSGVSSQPQITHFKNFVDCCKNKQMTSLQVSVTRLKNKLKKWPKF